MNNKPVIFIGSLLIIALIVIISFIISTYPFGDATHQHQHQHQHDEETQSQQPAQQMQFGEEMTTYGQACASCHGKFGEGVAGFTSIQNTSLSVEEIKTIIRNGKGDMPGFEHIEEPLLTKLAEFVKKL